MKKSLAILFAFLMFLTSASWADGLTQVVQPNLETIGAKLKRIRTNARFNNANDNPPLQAIPAWTATTAVYIGNLRSSNGGIYICVVSGTTGTASQPSGIATSVQVDGTVSWVYYGAITTTLNDALAPIVTTALVLPTRFPTIYTTVANANANQLFYSGGSPTVSFFGAAKAAPITSFNKTATSTTNSGWSITTETSASKVLLAVGQNVGGAGNGNTLRVIIDNLDGKGERYLNLDPFIIPVATPDPQYFITLDFTNVGGNKVRRISVEGASINYGFHSFRVAATDTCWKPFYPDFLNVLHVGDSIAEGYAANLVGAANSIGADNAPNKLGKKLGFKNVVNISAGGTGYINNNTNGFTYNQRLTSQLNPTVLATNFDLIIFDEAIINDSGFAGATAASVQAAALATFQTARAQWPNAIIWVVGGWPVGNPQAGSNFVLFEAAVQAAVTQFGDSKTYYTSPLNDVMGAWITGTGKSSAPAGNGNNDYFTSSDGVNPNDLGTSYRTNRLANAYDRDVLGVLK